MGGDSGIYEYNFPNMDDLKLEEGLESNVCILSKLVCINRISPCPLGSSKCAPLSPSEHNAISPKYFKFVLV